jgi:hypothetical protein
MRAIQKFQKGDNKLEKLEPGEKDFKTKLYDPIFTPHAEYSTNISFPSGRDCHWNDHFQYHHHQHSPGSRQNPHSVVFFCLHDCLFFFASRCCIVTTTIVYSTTTMQFD